MTRPPDHAAREQALDLHHHVLCVAPAGSGKTSLLVRRMLRALATVDRPEQVVAITFTNKAAAEIRHRILALLQRAADGATPKDDADAAALIDAQTALQRDASLGWQLRAQPGRITAFTIDSFNAQIAAQLPLLSRLGGGVRVTEDAQALYEQAVLDLYSQLDDPTTSSTDRDYLGQVLRLAQNRLDILIPSLCGLLERRDQWLAAATNDEWLDQESPVLAALMTEQCSQLKSLIGESALSSFLTIAKSAATCDNGDDYRFALSLKEAPDVDQIDAWRAIAKCLLTQHGKKLRATVNTKQGFPPKQNHTVAMNQLLSGWNGDDPLEACLMSVYALPDAVQSVEYSDLRQALLRVLILLYAQLKLVFGQRGETDFTEVALAAAQALQGDGVSDALLQADRAIRHLLVDEMQDTSEIQIRLLKLLTSEWQPDDGHSLFLVGDPQQSIYAFRNAEVSLFQVLIAQQALDHLPLTVLRLSANFRSAPVLVDWFNQQFQRIFLPKEQLNIGAVTYVPSAACAKVPPASFVDYQVWLEADRQHEAAEIAELAAARLASCGQNETVAILVRARSHLKETLSALRNLGISVRCTDMDALEDMPAVGDVIALARALWHPEDSLYWARLLRAPFVGLSWADMLALSRGRVKQSWPQRLAETANCALSGEGVQRVQRLITALQHIDANVALRGRLVDRCEALWVALNGPACLTAEDLTDVQATFSLLRQQCPSGGFEDLPSFGRALSRLFASAHSQGIEVMTIHKAKGLEFDHVLLPALNRKPKNSDSALIQMRNVTTRTVSAELLAIKPPDHWGENTPELEPAERFYQFLSKQQQLAQTEEAKRLLYVAVTRAKRSLTLLTSAEVDPEGNPKWSSKSFAEMLVVAKPTLIPVQPAAPNADAAEDTAPPISPRLRLNAPPIDWNADDLYRPREQRQQKPSEAVLSATSGFTQDDEFVARQIGILLHQAFEKIAQEGLAAWVDAGESRRASLVAGLRHAGVPEPRVQPALHRILTLLRRTLSSDIGRWLLSPKPWAASEYPLSSHLNGRWISAVIDRCFVEETGDCWVVDYKSSAEPIADDAVESYIDHAVERYRPQLALYRDLMAMLRPNTRIRTALYLVDVDRLVEL